MAITDRNSIAAAIRQRVKITRTVSRTAVANIPFSVFDLAGDPGAGTLNVGNTAAGLVPTDAVAGYPIINAFSGANTGYISRLRFQNSVAGWIDLYDRLFAAGAYSFNSNVTLASQPSYASRIPSADYTGTEIWIEAVTAFTGNLSVVVTYTNQAGTAGRSTGTVATGAALQLGRCVRLPLQAGDTGVQQINSVVATVATVGTFNVMVLRNLGSARIQAANGGEVQKWDATDLPIVFADSAFYPLITADSTATGIPIIDINVMNA